jgi:hypothetical protein
LTIATIIPITTNTTIAAWVHSHVGFMRVEGTSPAPASIV